MELDKSHIDEVEHRIGPPMDCAITISVSNGVVIYVCSSSFNPTTEKAVIEVARRLKLE